MQRFKIQQQIGNGAYSVVFRAYDKQKQMQVAVKKIEHTCQQIKMVLHRQIRILKRLSHPNIIKLLDVVSDSTHTYLIFEYMAADLISFYKQVQKKKQRNLTDSEITYIAFQIAEGLGYMHQLGIMHRDIKPENILIDPQTLSVRIIDFGFATQSSAYGQNTQYMVTRWYRPLEIVLGLQYDLKVDVFSLGALLMELYNGEEIFRSASNVDQMYWIVEVCGYPSWGPAVSKMVQLGISPTPNKEPMIYSMTRSLRPQARNIIISMLQTNPFSRPSIPEILTHPYFGRYFQKFTPTTTISKKSTPQGANTPSNNKNCNIGQHFAFPETNTNSNDNSYLGIRIPKLKFPGSINEASEYSARESYGYGGYGYGGYGNQRKSQVNGGYQTGQNFRGESRGREGDDRDSPYHSQKRQALPGQNNKYVREFLMRGEQKKFEERSNANNYYLNLNLKGTTDNSNNKILPTHSLHPPINYNPANTDRTNTSNHNSHPNLQQHCRRFSYNTKMNNNDGVIWKAPDTGRIMVATGMNAEPYLAYPAQNQMMGRNIRMSTMYDTREPQGTQQQYLCIPGKFQQRLSTQTEIVKSDKVGMKLVSLRKDIISGRGKQSKEGSSGVTTRSKNTNTNQKPQDKKILLSRKDPAFSKLRGKLAPPGSKAKISLTDRNGLQFRKNKP